MRTLALALSAAVLGTGCFIDTDDDCDESTVTVEWSTFLAGNGDRLGCAGADVEFIDIYMDGTLVDSWGCSDGGALITGVQQGSYLFTVEGVEANGRIAFRDEQQVSASSCGGRLIRAVPAEGIVELEYSFSPVNECAGDPSYLWFHVFDEVAAAVTAAVDDASSNADKVFYECPAVLELPLPAGPHTLDWMQEMVQTGPSAFDVTGAQCSPTSFDVPRGGFVAVPVVMTDATVPCT